MSKCQRMELRCYITAGCQSFVLCSVPPAKSHQKRVAFNDRGNCLSSSIIIRARQRGGFVSLRQCLVLNIGIHCLCLALCVGHRTTLHGRRTDGWRLEECFLAKMRTKCDPYWVPTHLFLFRSVKPDCYSARRQSSLFYNECLGEPEKMLQFSDGLNVFTSGLAPIRSLSTDRVGFGGI